MKTLLAAVIPFVIATSDPASAVETHRIWPSNLSPQELSHRLEEGARRPLGSRENPVRVFMPEGEREYLSRLRCSDGAAPAFGRTGSYRDPGVYGHVVDIYDVRCRSGDPPSTEILMDMYFADHVETGAPAGFTLVASNAGSGNTPPASRPPEDSERLQLARQLAEIFWPRSDESAAVGSSVRLMEGLWALTSGFSVSGMEFAEPQFTESLKTGARRAWLQSRELKVRAYAEKLTVDDLRTALAFYRSSAGRAAIQARATFMAKVVDQKRRTEDPYFGLPTYLPTAAERAFEASSAGRAVAEIESPDALADELQRPIDATEADYCAQVNCSIDHRIFFMTMAGWISRSRARGEHAMSGTTAAELFSDLQVLALVRAACVGDTEAIAAAAKRGANPNFVGQEALTPGLVHQTVTPLLWAVDCGNVVGIGALLKAGADPNQRESFGATPVTVAAANPNPAILQLLLKEGGDPNAHDESRTALEIAVEAESGFEYVMKVPKERVRANWDALLAAGADPDRLSPQGAALIETAAMSRRFEVVEQLIDRGWQGDMVSLGRTLETSEEAGHFFPGALAALHRVKARLAARGVRFPVGALMDLKRDARGFYVQP